MRSIAIIFSFLLSGLIGLKMLQLLFIKYYIKQHQLPDMQKFKTQYALYSQSDLLELGHLANYHLKSSQFKNFDTKKRPEIIRIGCFGDSFTEGEEVENHFDYPAQLARLFKEAGINNVEVLNFGVGGHGFQQSYNMFHRFGTNYDLDYLLLGPVSFQASRDVWLYKQNIGGLYSIKPRYVIAGNSVKLIRPEGNDHYERLKNTYSIVPGSTFFFYDRNHPAYWSKLLQLFGFSTNPFYYTHLSPFDEAKVINSYLLKNLIRGFDGDVIMLAAEPHTFSAYKALRDQINLSATFSKREEFPYWRNCHSSSLGYFRYASAFLASLLKKQKLTMTTPKVLLTDPDLVTEETLDTNNVVTLKLFYDDLPIGSLESMNPHNEQPLNTDNFNFLYIKEADLPFLSGIILKTKSPLNVGQPVLGKIANRETVFFGKIKVWPQLKNFFFVEVDKLTVESWCHSTRLYFEAPILATEKDYPNPFWIDLEIPEGSATKRQGPIIASLSNSEVLRFMGPTHLEGSKFNGEKLGPLYLSVTYGDGRQVDVEMRGIKMRTETEDVFLHIGSRRKAINWDRSD